MRLVAVGCCALLSSCGASRDCVPDASTADSSTADATTRDATTRDATTRDAGADAGSRTDAAATTDASIDASVDASGPLRIPARVNAMQTTRGALLALYAVTDAAYPADRVAFRFEPGTSVEALGPDESVLWSAPTDAVEMTGGFDLDRDGWLDLALVHQTVVGSCNASLVTDRHLEFVSGRTGTPLARWMTTRDLCWTFPTTAYATTQWSVLGVLFGDETRFVSLQTQYETQGFFAAYDSATGALSPQHAYVYPSTSQYGEYTAALPNAYGGTPWVDNAHVANGLVVSMAGEERVVFFTSARLVVYRAAAYGPGQLLIDRPFVARTDIAGRNYGLVSLDPEVPSQLSLVAGTDMQTVHDDRVAGARASDPWAAIERHLTVFDLSTGVLSQRFYSYAHDGGDAQQYEGRVVYPANPHVRRGAGAPSRLAYDVFGGGHWELHVSTPAATADEVVLPSMVLWDIRDLDGDGTDEWILSFASTAPDPYLPEWRTRLCHWNETSRALDDVGEEEGIPELVASFRDGRASTSRGFLAPAAVVLGPDGRAHLLMRHEDGTRTLAR